MLAAAVLLLCVRSFSPAANAGELPLWEAGAGVGVLSFPDYRGSDERRQFLLPVPYLIYRGEFLKADREGLRGEFFGTDRITLELSLNASVPVDSTDNAARAGMPDLDPTIEVGPNLKVNLFRSAGGRVRTALHLPVRSVLAIGRSGVHDVGWVAQPHFNADVRDVVPGSHWDLGVALGPVFGDRRYHGYFYGVAPVYATAARSAYGAPGGYSGTQFTVALSKRYDSYWVGAFVRYDSLSGAAFEPSPLVKQTDSLAAGVAVSWILARSGRSVPAPD